MLNVKTHLISGLLELQPQIFNDERGLLLESYNMNDFKKAGIKDVFVQDNHSLSQKGVIRGLHFQKKHSQAKLVRAVTGKIFDVAVDLRCSSPTFGKYFSVILDSRKQNMLYIPRGFAHGSFAMEDNSILSYKCSDFYCCQSEGGLIWNDALLSIDWPLETVFSENESPVLSRKDCMHPAFNPEQLYFDINGNWIGE